MYFPNRQQWLVLYVAVPLALTVWTNAPTSSQTLSIEERGAVSLAIGAAFLCWRLSRKA